MSGGSWNYFYSQVDDVADRLMREGGECPERIAFGRHLGKCARALRDIEWADSGDTAHDSEIPAILECITPAAVLEVAFEQAERAAVRLERAIAAATERSTEAGL